jgi:hypothetical protein
MSGLYSPVFCIIEVMVAYTKLCWPAVYYVGPGGWKKMSGDDVGELHYSYYPVQEAPAETEMGEA